MNPENLNYDSLLVVCAVAVWDPVYFKARLTSNLVLNPHKDIIFKDVNNNVGNGYNPDNGRFVVPKSGTYLFIVSVMPQPKFDGYGENWEAKFKAEVVIVIDGQDGDYGYAFSSSYCKSSAHCIVTLHAGQEVWVKTWENKTSLLSSCSTYFSAVLLYPSN